MMTNPDTTLDTVEAYNLVSDVVGRRPRESLVEAAHRLMAAPSPGPAWRVAHALISIDKPTRDEAERSFLRAVKAALRLRRRGLA